MSHADPAELVPLARYREKLLARISPLEPTRVGLLDAQGCVLAEDVTAPSQVPPFASSAMDGFALRAQDGLATRRVVDSVAAGAVAARAVGAGEAIRIMTGAPVPAGADCIVPFEIADTEREVGPDAEPDAARGRVRPREVPERGANVRPAGQDVGAGAVVLRAGRHLGPAELGLLATVGKAQVLVHPAPRVVVISTGDELLEPDEPDRPGAIRDSNSYALTALAREAGALAVRSPIVRDDPAALRAAFEGALRDADVLVTSGGVSAGDFDHVKGVLAELGDVRFSKVGMQPGMPQAFGLLHAESGAAVPCFGLPGNPVSCYVSFEVFVRPALRRMQGRSDLDRQQVRARAAEPLHSPAHKTSFLRVVLKWDEPAGVWEARLTGAQGSGLLSSVVAADGLAEIPVDRTDVTVGEELVVHLLADRT